MFISYLLGPANVWRRADKALSYRRQLLISASSLRRVQANKLFSLSNRGSWKNIFADLQAAGAQSAMQQLMLAALVCIELIAASTGQQEQQQQHELPELYYCNSSFPVNVSGQKSDFSVITRPQHNASDWPGLVCEFFIDLPGGNSSAGRLYLLDVESFSVGSAVLSIVANGHTYIRSSRLLSHQSSLAIPSGDLNIRFNATDRFSEGIKIRIRAFSSHGCPPDWVLLAGSCFGTSSAKPSLDYFSAQRACNSMRANLLHLPQAYLDSAGAFSRMLPQSLRRGYTWIGLTDRTRAGQFQHFWLDGKRQYRTSEISCFSSGAHFRTCRSNERCGTFYDAGRQIYAIYMANCLHRNKFLCSMPPGGASILFPVPGGGGPGQPGDSSSRSAWVWGGIAAGLLVLGLVVIGAHSLLNSNRSRQAATAGPAASASGRAASANNSDAGGVQAVCRYPEPPPPPPPPPPPKPLINCPVAPPSYDAAMSDRTDGGYRNAGFSK